MAHWLLRIRIWLRTPILFLLIAASVLAGCAIVDQYSGRAISYNLEAEQALDQGLLLNIVRASLRRPMQFTSVSTITGTATASASATFTVPFIPGAGSSAFNPTLSGGPSFTVPVLDTKEFYQGVMSPISSQLVDFYVHEEFPREELFTLFTEKIVVHRDACRPEVHTGNCEIIFANYPGSDLQFDLTQSLIEYLINLGITTEQLPSPGGKSGGGGGGGGSSGSDSGDQSQSSGPSYRLCFAPHDPRYAAQIKKPSSLCLFSKQEKPKPKLTYTWTDKQMILNPNGKVTREMDSTISQPPDAGDDGQEIKKRTTIRGFVFSKEFRDKLRQIAQEDTKNPGKCDHGEQDNPDYCTIVNNLDAFGERDSVKANTVTLAIYSRSTEGILYFLGEVVRRALGPDQALNPAQQPRTLQIKIETTSYRHFPEEPCVPNQPLRGEVTETNPDGVFKCENLFVLDENRGLGPAIGSVSYNGVHYSVPADSKSAGKTLHVLSIVKQLLAVNTSAKSLPQTNVLGVISQ